MSPVVPTAPSSRPQTPPAAPTRGFRTIVTKAVRARFQTWRNRRSAATLLHLDANLLKDIGLTHTDVALTLKRADGDPSAELQRLAEERRGDARSLATRRLADVLGVKLS